MIKPILLCVIVACWIIGGQKSNRYRDVPVPIILALYFAIALKTWWLFMALGVTYQAIRLGYGAYDPENDDKPSFLATITGDRQGWYIRVIWGLIVASVGALPLVLGRFMDLCPYLGYIIGNAVVNFLVTRLRLGVFLTDIFVALAIGSILYLV